MKVRYVGVSFGADSLTDGKIYDVVELDEFSGGLRVVDDSGEDYLYSPPTSTACCCTRPPRRALGDRRGR